MSSIAYMRGIFPDDSFATKMLDNIEVKVLRKFRNDSTDTLLQQVHANMLAYAMIHTFILNVLMPV